MLNETLDDQALLQVAFDSARSGMAVVAPNGRFIRVNPAFSQIVGYPTEELERLTFQEVTHPDDLAYDLEQLGKLLRGEIADYEMEKRYVRKDGSVVWTHLSRTIVRSHSGQPVCFPVHLEDLSEHKEEEAKLSEALKRWVNQEESDLLDSPSGVRLLKVVRVLSHEPSLLRQEVGGNALTKLLTKPSRENAKAKTLLTEREREVSNLVTQGKTSKEIAALMQISPRTVEVHRASATRKIKAGLATDLVRHAIRANIKS